MTASSLTGAPNTRGSDFRPMCAYISEMVIDRGILTVEDEYKDVYALSNSATFDDRRIEWRYLCGSIKSEMAASSHLGYKNDHNFATGLPIDLMFGSRVGFPAELDFFLRSLHTRTTVARNPGLSCFL